MNPRNTARDPKTGRLVPVPVLDRFWVKVQRGSDAHCWLWLAHTARTGYAMFWTGQRLVMAHRFAYELLVGPIPPGLVIDHLCRNRRCVNPAHMEPVTTRENILRGTSPSAVAARRDTCAKGHPWTPENTGPGPRGSRHCRACSRRTSREWAAKQRAAA